MNLRYSIFPLLLCSLLSGDSVHAQGHSIRGKEIVVSTQKEWMDWQFPKDVVEIGRTGRVRPVYVRKDINAVLDAKRFLHEVKVRYIDQFPYRRTINEMIGRYEAAGGVKNAGSNLREAGNTIDGDPFTFWEPDREEPMEHWWFEVDLGRVVAARRIVLRFVEEGMGDPFYKFRILVSRGEPAFYGSPDFGWQEIFRQRTPNVDGRIFEIPLDAPVGAEGEGDEIHYLRVVVSDTRGDRGEEVSWEEYRSLPEEMQGGKAYHKKTPMGEREIPKEGYDALAPEDRGRILYYRHELPRLAELEVWTLGENISLGTVQRGGAVDKVVTVDGDYTTLGRIFVHPEREKFSGISLDLGAVFWVDMIRMTNSFGVDPTAMHNLMSYKIIGSDGTVSSAGDVVWDALTSEDRLTIEATTTKLRRTEDRFDLRKIRFLTLRFQGPGRQFSLNEVMRTQVGEFQVYGEGYVPEITMTSPLIRLTSLELTPKGPKEIKTKSLTFIRWDADVSEDASLEIRTRTGDRLRKVKHFYDLGGNEISELQYNDLPGFVRGIETMEMVLEDGVWSRPYSRSGARVSSPSPRRFLQVQVRLASEDPDLCATLRSLSVGFFKPLSERSVGEIWPCVLEDAGKLREFSLFVRSTFAPSSQGFDEVLVHSLHRMMLRLVEVRFGGEDDFRERRTEAFAPAEMEMLPAGPDSIWVRLPRVIRSGDAELMEIRFETRIFLHNTPFEVFLTNSEDRDARQMVDPENATLLTESSTMTVALPYGKRVLGELSIAPNPFSPNGDGINDEAAIEFVVFKVDMDKRIGIEVYDLFGRRHRRMVERRMNASGIHSVMWDGRDDDGRLVPPGVYLVRVHTDADSKLAEHTALDRTVYVAY